MKKILAILGAVLMTASVHGQTFGTPSPLGIPMPIKNGHLKSDLDAENHQIKNLDVTPFPFQPVNANLTAIANGTVTDVGLNLLQQPDLASLQDYVGTGGGSGTTVNDHPSVSGQFLTGFDSGTGNFDSGAVDYADITNPPPLPVTVGVTANQYLQSYDSVSGNFTTGGVAFSGVTGTATNGQLPTTLSSKTLDDTNSITVKDGNLVIENSGTSNKHTMIDGSAITPGQTRKIVMGDFNGTPVKDQSAVSHQFLTSIVGGIPQLSQPAFTDISGVAISGQLPSLDDITAPAADVDLNGHKIINLSAPTSPGDATTKTYVDAALSSAAPPPHLNVAAATTGNITLSGEQTIDGFVTSGSRVLVKNQSTATQNGIYVTASGSWTRATDADTGAEIPGLIFVSNGTVNAYTDWGCTNPLPITLGSDDLTYTQTFAVPTYTAINGINLTGTQFSAVGTTNRITTGSTIDIASNYAGQSSINTLGTVTAGTWNGSTIAGQYGGTGVANTGKTITLGGNMVTTGDTNITGTNSGDVTISGQNYLSLSGQTITANAIDLSGTNVTGFLAAARMPAVSGDINNVAGTMAFSLSSHSVTNSKLQQMAANSIKGNNTGTTANAQDLTTSQTKTLLALNNVENTALSTWAGSANITTLGTVTTGTWNAGTISLGRGGTGATTSSGALDNLMPAGTTGQALVKTSGGWQLESIYRRVNIIWITTAGSGTYTPTAGTAEAYIEVMGAGGGGGGSLGGTSVVSAGSGGGGGSYSAKWISSPLSASYSYTVGAGGTAGASGGGTGGTGGATSFGSGPLVQALGGLGGVGMSTGTDGLISLGGAGGTASIGDISIKGSPGANGIRLSGTIGAPGGGGAGAVFGSMSGSLIAQGDGTNGSPGSGAGGALSTSTNHAGGTGGNGMIKITEYLTVAAP